MRLREFTETSTVIDMFKKFIPIAIEVLKLRSLPTFEFEAELNLQDQPSFGVYINGEKTLFVALRNRHPNDIFRTIAHELTHYKQDTEGRLTDMSGQTGSDEENQAHAMAGIIMRHFNKRYPKFFKSKPII